MLTAVNREVERFDCEPGYSSLTGLILDPHVRSCSCSLVLLPQPTRGGALYVQLDASATFMGTAFFHNLSVAEQPLSDTTDFFGITKKGGAIHNKVNRPGTHDVYSLRVFRRFREESMRGGSTPRVVSPLAMR